MNPIVAALVIRVLTFNAWDLPVVSEDRPNRIARIGPAIAALAPDLVAMQEVWTTSSAETISAELAKAGLVHIRRLPERSGLLLASRYPIVETSSQTYGFAGKPHKPQHADWYASKGMVLVRLETPEGPLDFADTHLHAGYRDDPDYLVVRLAQAIQLAGALPPPGAPLVVAGDVNARKDTLPFRALTSRARLEPVPGDFGIDWIFTRPGAEVGLRCLEAKFVLRRDETRLSDHSGVLAVLELSREKTPPRESTWPAVAAEARPVLEAARARASTLLLVEGGLGLVLAAASVPLFRRTKRRVRWLVPLAALPFLYLGLVYEPMVRRGCDAALAALP